MDLIIKVIIKRQGIYLLNEKKLRRSKFMSIQSMFFVYRLRDGKDI